MPDEVAENLVTPIKAAYPDSAFKRKNVIVFILESFNREWIGNLNNRYFYTPFLDSISAKSWVCENAFANAKHSNEGLPAILASIPSLMNESIISSPYQSNYFQGLGNILKPLGYKTSFFHGARNGSFNFNQFAKSIGFENYYGMDEYPDKSHFDGNWGIWDHHFLKFFSRELEHMPQPFASVFFNISSHYPFSIPKEFEKEFKDEPFVNQLPSTVRYVDYSLKLFFEANKDKDWFKNTLFVFCADHTGEGNEPIYKTPIGIFRIPIIFYDPSIEKHISITKPVMQVDVLPSIIDYLKVPAVHFSFGHSVFDKNSYPAYQYHENYYQVCNDSLLYFFDGNKVRGCYNIKKDLLLEKNLWDKDSDENYEIDYLKAVIQVYRKRLIHNKLIP
jgi:phosphoglycerol transferase MdoB-like AlkP superfamily enzyme